MEELQEGEHWQVGRGKGKVGGWCRGGLKGRRCSVDGEAMGQCLSCHRLQLGLPRHCVRGKVDQGC